DITSSGETLRANHLRPLRDGLVHKSQATLFRARRAAWSDESRADWLALRARLGL
ncbi:MAG: ATP phosphoribosyltransferase catalytic subunit HisG, partial [Pseudomonadota bacterium]